MHTFDFVIPKYIRQYKLGYKMLQLDQKTESLHHIINELERGLINIPVSGKRILTAIRLYQNKQKS